MIQKVIIYHALRQPHVVARLRDELDAADLSYTVPYKQTWQLAYLDAIVQEALRIHPPLSGLKQMVPDVNQEGNHGRRGDRCVVWECQASAVTVLAWYLTRKLHTVTSLFSTRLCLRPIVSILVALVS